MRTTLAVCAIAASIALPAQSQSLRLGLNVGGISYSEVGEQLQYDGGAAGAFLDFRFGKFMVMGEGYLSRLDPDEETGLTEQLDLRQLDVRVAYFFNPALAVQIGGSGRQAKPENTTSDVGFFRIGLISENQLGSIGRIWVRGAYIPAPQFSGGGSSEFAFEIGLGTWIGTSNGRFGARLEYDFQRLDRQVNDVDVPQQLMVARIGLEIGF